MTTYLTDTFTGTATSNLSAHTADSGNTYTAGTGTILLDGVGGIYSTNTTNQTTFGTNNYSASGTFPSSTTVNITFTMKCLSDQNFNSVMVTDGTNAYSLIARPTSSTPGWQLNKFTLPVTGSTVLGSSTTALLAGHNYECTFTVNTNGTTVALTANVFDITSNILIWNSGPVNDTSFPAVNQIGVRGLCFVAGPDTPTTGFHVTNLNATTSTLAVSPATVSISSTGNTLTLTGTGTSWTAGTPGTPTFTASAGTITAQVVNSTTSATLTYSAPVSVQDVLITDPGTGAPTTLSIVNLIPVNSASLYFSPFNWKVNGSTSATCPYGGGYLKFNFSNTSCTLNLNTSSLGANPLYIWVSIDGATPVITNIQGLSALTIATGLASGTHTAVVAYYGRTFTVDAWNTPVSGLVITGILIDGAISAPTVYSDTMLVYGDSQFEGTNIINANNLASSAADTLAAPYFIAEAFQCELGNCCVGGQGWQLPGLTNVPGLFIPGSPSTSAWNSVYSGVSRSFTAQPKYILVKLGTNDFNNGITGAQVQASVTGWLTAMRAACSTSTIVVCIPYELYYQSFITAGFNAYQAATPDTKALLIVPALTAQQIALLSGSTTNYFSNAHHPNSYGQSFCAATIIQKIQTAVSGSGGGGNTTGVFTGIGYYSGGIGNTGD